MLNVKRVTGRRGVRERAQVRAEEPLCRMCLAKGRVSATTQVDHIIPLSQGGSDDRGNKQGLCDLCHLEKTFGEVAEVGLDGWPVVR